MAAERQLLQTNVPGLYRDMSSGMILNKNIGEYNQYMVERARLVDQAEINKKVDELSTAVTEIKDILKQLAKCVNHGN